MRLKVSWILILTILAVVFLRPGKTVFAESPPEIKSFQYNDHGKRDPFWTLLGHRGSIMNYDNDLQASDMALEGIMAEPAGDSVAIINGNIVKVGDKVGFFIVKEIKGNVVTLQKGQEIITLKLKKEE